SPGTVDPTLLKLEEGKGDRTVLKQDLEHLSGLLNRQSENRLGTLEVTLGPLAAVGDQILVTAGGVSMRELLSRPGSVRLALPYHAHNKLAALLGQVVLALHTNAGLATPPGDRARLKVGVIDEAGPFITERFTQAIALGR